MASSVSSDELKQIEVIKEATCSELMLRAAYGDRICKL